MEMENHKTGKTAKRQQRGRGINSRGGDRGSVTGPAMRGSGAAVARERRGPRGRGEYLRATAEKAGGSVKSARRGGGKGGAAAFLVVHVEGPA